jgi:hypothetical protein
MVLSGKITGNEKAPGERVSKAVGLSSRAAPAEFAPAYFCSLTGTV